MNKLKKILILTIFIITSLVAFTSVNATVSDVENHWAKNEINEFYEKGFVEGTPDGNFRPDDEITKIEFAKIINKYFAYEVDNKINWQDANLAVAKEKNYMSISNNNDKLTREEACTIITKLINADLSLDYEINYLDSEDISVWAIQSVKYLSYNKNINGYVDKTFMPKKNITRAEVVKILHSLTGIGGTDIVEADPITTLEIAYIEYSPYGMVVTQAGEEIELQVDEEITLAAIIPDDVDDTEIKWTFTNEENKIEFDEDTYNLKAISEGKVKIKLQTKDKKYRDIVYIIIK